MKTKNYFLALLIGLSVVALTQTSCKKDELTKGTNDHTSMSNLSEDEIAVEEAMNETLDDVEGFMSNENGNGNGNLKSGRIPCNATVDSTEIVNDTITIYITYDGLSCNGRFYRTGQVEIRKRVGTHFGMEGASVNIRHINFTVTRVRTSRTITLNGSKTFTNVTGGFMFMLGHNDFNTLIHRIRGRMHITFANGNSKTWFIAHQRTYTGTRGNFILTIDGYGSADGYDNLITWGFNRNEEQFYTQITQSVVHKQTCDWNPVSGIKIHMIPAAEKSATVTFGYDSNNQPVTGDECPTHYKVDWVNGTYTGTRFVPLP